MREKKKLTVEQINVILPERLKFFREQKGFSLREVANEIGKSPSQISFWERGVNHPNCMDLFKLCETYNINLFDLFPESKEGTNLNKDEIDLVKKYRKSNKETKTIIKMILDLKIRDK